MGRISTFRRLLGKVFEATWFRIVGGLWAALGAYDLATSQLRLENWPKLRDFVAMTTDWLNPGNWTLVALLILVCALIEQNWRLHKNSNRDNIKLALNGACLLVPKEMPNTTGIGINADVWKISRSAHVVEWKLEVVLASHEVVAGKLSLVSEAIKRSDPFFGQSDSLPEKAKSVEIGSKPISGTLLFYVPRARNLIASSETTIELSAIDTLGDVGQVKQKFGDWLHLPGTLQ